MPICVPVGRPIHLISDAEMAGIWATAPLSHGPGILLSAQRPTRRHAPLCLGGRPADLSLTMSLKQPYDSVLAPFSCSQEQSCPLKDPVGDTVLLVPKGRPTNSGLTAASEAAL